MNGRTIIKSLLNQQKTELFRVHNRIDDEQKIKVHKTTPNRDIENETGKNKHKNYNLEKAKKKRDRDTYTLQTLLSRQIPVLCITIFDVRTE